jgi:hypothetical protein
MANPKETTDPEAPAQDTDQGGTTLTETAPAEVTPVAPVDATVEQTQAVSGPAATPFQTFEASTLVEELPEQELVAAIPAMYLLLNDRDETHALTAPQMGVIVSHIKQKFGPGTTYGDAVVALRKQHLQGRQKDWNIVNAVSAESRLATAHEMMTEGQERMLYEAILPALAGHAEHWDPQIQSRIANLKQSTREILLNQTLEVTTRGEVSLFMKKFENLCGRPQKQQPGGITGSAPQSTGVPVGAGVPGGGIQAGSEAF